MSTRPLRRWIIWTVIGVWVVTGLLILALSQVHPRVLANVSVLVRRFSFKTNANTILSSTTEKQLLISGISSLELRGQALNVTANDRPLPKAGYLKVDGRSLASCSFRNVTSGGLELSDSSLITLIWPGPENRFSITSHGSLKGKLTSQPGGYVTCRNVEIDGNPLQTVDVEFSRSGGDNLNFTTVTDARLDFGDIESSPLGDSQILISEPLNFWYVEPGADTTEAKTVLRAPASGQKNRITFDDIGKEIILDNADLMVIVPDNKFYLREFKVDGGIALSLHGVVSEIEVGAGAQDLRNKMPSLLDHMDAKSRVLALIPAIVVLLIGILEKMKVLPGK